ncbi:MAG: hypothetical protein V3T05_00195 [Myxococcota bacterium]
MNHAIVIIAATLTAPQPGKTVEFVGFSLNEAAAAFRVDVVRPDAQGSFVDRYRLIRLVETSSSHLLATFKGSGVLRIWNDGRRRHTTQAVLARANPEWANALPKKEWTRLRRKGRFKGKVLQMDDSALRLSRDTDAPGELKAEPTWIDFHGERGAPVGFQPVARMVDGELISLGAYRREGEPGRTWHARVWVHHSRTGSSVAVLVRFDPGDGSAADWQGHVLPLPEPIGTTSVGVMNLVFSQLRQAAGRYKSMHPGYSDMYDQYVGRHW